jgi:hypothetical protein
MGIPVTGADMMMGNTRSETMSSYDFHLSVYADGAITVKIRRPGKLPIVVLSAMPHLAYAIEKAVKMHFREIEG